MKTLILSLGILLSTQAMAGYCDSDSQASQVAFSKIEFVKQELAKKIVHPPAYLRRIVLEMTDAMQKVNDCHLDMIVMEAGKVLSDPQVERLLRPAGSPQVARGGHRQ